jgi:glycine betaine/proline transport system substrate-binding protein
VKKNKIGAFLACALLATGVSACSGATDPGAAPQASDKTITFVASPGYDNIVSLNALWEQLLAEHGYTLKTTQVDIAAGFAGIARGDLDGYIETWLPSTHGTYVDKYKDQLQITEKPFYDNDRLVLVAPKSVPENTISEVVNNAEKYGNKIVGIEAGSGEMKILPEVVKKYGATDKLKIIEGSTPATLAALKDAAAKGEPLIATLWEPHWAFASMPIKVIQDDLGAWPKPDQSHTVFSKKFAAKEPQVVKWMTNMKLTDDQFASLMSAVRETPDNPGAGAKKWLEDPENRKTADSWFS